MKKPELLAPAGSLKTMRHALAYGADAVYAGEPRYSLRARNNSFNKKENLQLGIDETHAQNKKFLLAVNILPHNNKLNGFLENMAPVIDMGPDALIMADPGLIMMVREKWPEMPIHLSVQMNTVNYASVKFWEKMGVERIILSRELSLNEMEEIRQQCPDIELEVFVHGSLCMAYSGRCLLSGYFNKRDSNQGVCTNACRWKYKTTEAEETDDGAYASTAESSCSSISCLGGGEEPNRHPDADQVYFLEEKNRPGELMPIFEDEHGTYIMNSKDLRAIEHVQRLVEIGIDCLKIEGRTKSHYYAARTAQIYRKAIDLAAAGKDLKPELIGALENLAHRGYTDGFYQRHSSDSTQKYLENASLSHRQKFVGEALEVSNDGWMTVEVKNKFHVGDRLELILPDGNNREIILEKMEDLEGNSIQVAPGSKHQVRIPVQDINSQMVLISRFLKD